MLLESTYMILLVTYINSSYVYIKNNFRLKISLLNTNTVMSFFIEIPNLQNVYFTIQSSMGVSPSSMGITPSSMGFSPSSMGFIVLAVWVSVLVVWV